MRRAARLVGLNLLVLVLLALLVEGGARAYLSCGERPARHAGRQPAERLHTEYDPLLGWVHRPKVAIDDMYGPGRYLRTNAQRFRNATDIAPRVPPDRVRLICSGDSFTLGYGVSDDDAWCNRLARLEPRLEAVNLGQGGYGVDQAFLLYRREGLRLQHHVHAFAFIGADFRRLRASQRWGKGKPVLRLREGRLSVENVPVPRGPGRGLAGLLGGLAITRLLGRDAASLSARDAPPREAEELLGLADALVDRIATLGRERNARVLFVHLPTQRDLDGPSRDPVLRRFRERAGRDGPNAYLDLTEALRALPAAEAQALFLREPIKDFSRSTGHYNEAGNAFVAERVLGALRKNGMLPAADEDSR